MKSKFLAMLAKMEARKKALGEKANASTDAVELRGILAEIEPLNREIEEMRSMIAEMPDDAPEGAPEGRGMPQQPQGGFIPMASYGAATGPQIHEEKRGLDAVLAMPATTETEKAEMRTALFATPEYRTGYFKALAGKDNYTDAEKRALTTAANSGGAAVPTTTYDMIIKRMTQTSVLFGLIKKTFIPGNVVLPVADAQTAAQWSDTAPTPDNDDTLSQVSLGAYALSKFAKVKGQLILMAIDALEAYIVSAISDQLAIAVENAILNGTGSSQPTGILTGVTWTSANAATYATTVGYDDLVDAKKMLGLYRSNGVWVMNAAMEAQIYKIKTSVQQPLFTQNPITGLVTNPLGFPMAIDEYVPDNTILLINPDYYYMNINQNPTILSDDSAGFLSTSRVYRGTMFLDAKPALSSAFVKITKAA